jgi:predicted dehydrogenase
MRKIKIAQIGINRHSHAPDVFDTLRELPEVYDLAGYAIVEDERTTCAEKIKKHYAGYPELALEDILADPTIEAVMVETDEIHLLKYAQMAADAGKHIHMEKPGSQDLAAFERLVDTVRKNGTLLHLGYMYRYNPMVADVIRRAKAGEFGSIYSVEAHMSRFDKHATREWFGTFRGGMMFYLGCHLVDLVMQMQGEPTEVVPFNTRTGIGGVTTEDLGFAVLRYPHGVSVVRAGGSEIRGGYRRQLVVCGTERTVEVRPLEKAYHDTDRKYMFTTECIESFLDENGKESKEMKATDVFQRYEAMLLAFAAMVRGERENPNTPEYELALFRTILRCCGIN